MSKWKPIRTAPKDGTRVLIGQLHSTGAYVNIAWWADGVLFNGEEAGPNWVIHDCDDSYYTVIADAPTHWMPLPEVPK